MAANEQVIAHQQRAIRQLSTPVLQLRSGLLILPIVGALDRERLEQMRAALLEAIRARRARVVVLDVTGVPEIDTVAANQLIGVRRQRAHDGRRGDHQRPVGRDRPDARDRRHRPRPRGLGRRPPGRDRARRGAGCSARDDAGAGADHPRAVRARRRGRAGPRLAAHGRRRADLRAGARAHRRRRRRARRAGRRAGRPRAGGRPQHARVRCSRGSPRCTWARSTCAVNPKSTRGRAGRPGRRRSSRSS